MPEETRHTVEYSWGHWRERDKKCEHTGYGQWKNRFRDPFHKATMDCPRFGIGLVGSDSITRPPWCSSKWVIDMWLDLKPQLTALYELVLTPTFICLVLSTSTGMLLTVKHRMISGKILDSNQRSLHPFTARRRNYSQRSDFLSAPKHPLSTLVLPQYFLHMNWGGWVAQR